MKVKPIYILLILFVIFIFMAKSLNKDAPISIKSVTEIEKSDISSPDIEEGLGTTACELNMLEDGQYLAWSDDLGKYTPQFKDIYIDGQFVIREDGYGIVEYVCCDGELIEIARVEK